jgi:membrane-bound lytic murein transglycosylase D
MQQKSLQQTRLSALTLITLLLASLFIAACSTTPAVKRTTTTKPLPRPVATSQTAPITPKTIPTPPAQPTPAPPPTPVAEPTTAPDWLTIESTVVSLGEQDLFERIRMGFSLDDFIDHPSIDREEAAFANKPDFLDRTFRRGERYLYYIVSELEARQMPLELALLPVVESAFNPVALSTSQAAGLWQFIPSTGLRFGLKQNTYYDGRRDIVESTRAALDYLQYLNNEFDGDWLLAIAAYNTGEANVARAMRRNESKGLPTDFFSLDLARETEAYVPKLLAMRRIVADPAKHGLKFGTLQNEPYFVKVDVGGQIDLAVAASLADMPQEDFLALNPGFKHRYTDPNGPHQLLIPVASEEKFLQKLAALPSSQRIPVVYYRVRSGDTITKIAQRYGMTITELRTLNNLKTQSVKPGQELLLRSSSKTTALASIETRSITASKSTSSKIHTIVKGDTLWSIAKRYGVDPTVLASTNSLKKNAIQIGQKLKIPTQIATTHSSSNSSSKRITYVVKSGDTLSEIANQFKVTIKQIMSWNQLRSSTAIKTGQRLIILNDSHNLGG